MKIFQSDANHILCVLKFQRKFNYVKLGLGKNHESVNTLFTYLFIFTVHKVYVQYF